MAFVYFWSLSRVGLTYTFLSYQAIFEEYHVWCFICTEVQQGHHAVLVNALSCVKLQGDKDNTWLIYWFVHRAQFS